MPSQFNASPLISLGIPYNVSLETLKRISREISLICRFALHFTIHKSNEEVDRIFSFKSLQKWEGKQRLNLNNVLKLMDLVNEFKVRSSKHWYLCDERRIRQCSGKSFFFWYPTCQDSLREKDGILTNRNSIPSLTYRLKLNFKTINFNNESRLITLCCLCQTVHICSWGLPVSAVIPSFSDPYVVDVVQLVCFLLFFFARFKHQHFLKHLKKERL